VAELVKIRESSINEVRVRVRVSSKLGLGLG
jgi:hypothetical protein